MGKEIPDDMEGISVGGFGCFWVLLGFAILVNFPRILDIIAKLVK